MALNLYLVYRYGNAEGEDGPDDWDTTMLIRAATVAEAASVADRILTDMPVSCARSERSVQPFCHGIQELGIDAGTEQIAGIVLRPFINKGVVAVGQSQGYRFWRRENEGDEWRDEREIFGDEFFK